MRSPSGAQERGCFVLVTGGGPCSVPVVLTSIAPPHPHLKKEISVTCPSPSLLPPRLIRNDPIGWVPATEPQPGTGVRSKGRSHSTTGCNALVLRPYRRIHLL